MHFLRILTLLVFYDACSAYRILGAFPFNAPSHNIVFEALMKDLAKRGHQVDVITHFPLKERPANYREIINLDGRLERLVNNYTFELISQIQSDVVEHVAINYGNRICEFLGLDEMQRLIKNPPRDPPYDVVITESFAAHCYMGLGYVFNVPVISISSAIEYPWVSDFIGNDDNLAYVPNAFHVGAGQLSFWERVMNVASNYRALRKFHKVTEESQTNSMRKYLRADIPSIREVERNVALHLVNNHPILFGVKPMTPALIPIAGLHIEANDQSLTPELKKWLDESKDGVIYFSLGSMVLIESLPTHQLEGFYETFRKLAPINVLMKIANSTKLPAGLPKNVKVSSWIPQIPVLAHPNIKLFITHGGLGGLQEAMYFGLPMIGVPLFGDQFRNVESFVAKKMLLRLDFANLSGTSLESSINSVLSNPTYKEKAMYYSKIFRDRPMSALDTANFWIGYVIRNGGSIIKSPALSLPWWQLALLDVYGFFAFVVIMCFAVVILTLLVIIKKTRSRDDTPKGRKIRTD